MQHATDALKAYDHKPDCFKKAARALRHDCKNIEMDEDEKTKYAIRLTGCEIATADMPVPIECCGISSSMDKEPEDRRKPTSADITRCVQSLGRVPQLWTSYSGYFREVKVMCLAVRYSLEHGNFNQIKTLLIWLFLLPSDATFLSSEDLRNMQRNLTLSHAEQIALLREQRRELIETHRLETVRLQEILDIHSTITREVESMLVCAPCHTHRRLCIPYSRIRNIITRFLPHGDNMIHD
ncbi:hypothetical protein EDD21DRAFT_339906 [Dissophora ornata]|nr:hypothetical protein EDD21DRAFT_339906 [Dissophora ornata]